MPPALQDLLRHRMKNCPALKFPKHRIPYSTANYPQVCNNLETAKCNKKNAIFINLHNNILK